MPDTDRGWLTPNRRRVLASLGAGSLAALAGCASGDGDGGGTDTTSAGGTGGTDGTDGTTTGDGTTGGESRVTIGIAQGGWDLIPARDTDFVSNLVYTLIYDNVVNLTPDAEPVPELATDWTQESDTQYVFTLRDDVTFHDGTAFTAEDVQYTYNWITNNQNPRKNYVSAVSDVVVENDTTVRFDLSQPYAPFLYKVHAVMWPLSREAVESAGENYNTNPVGTGPYRLTSWESGNSAVLEAFDDYWRDDGPNVDTVEFRILPDASTRVTQLETGTVDLLDTMPAQYAQRVEDADGVTLLQQDGVASGRVDFNTSVEALGNRDVRRALAFATDKQQIVDTVFMGYADPAKSILPKSTAQYAGDFTDFSDPGADPQRARQLLSDAGYSDLSLEIKTSTRSEHTQTATLLQSMWSQAGVDVSVNSLNGNTFWTQEQNGDFEVGVSNWTWFGDPDTLLYLYHSEGLNVWNIDNAELDTMIENQRTTVDTQQRRQIIRDIQQTVYEEAYSLYTYYPRRLQGINDRIGGFEQYPNGSFRSLETASVE